MILKPAGDPAVNPSQEGFPLGSSVLGPWAHESAVIAGQIERAYPGYHVWTSDAGWWYATRRQPWEHGKSATVHGPGPVELSGALAEEEVVTIGRAMAGAW